MKTYKFYLNACNHFLNDPRYSELDKDEKEYVHISSVILSWISFESYINTACESLSHGTRLSEYLKPFLQEREIKINDDGACQKIKINPSTTKKLLFILHYFSKLDAKKFKQDKMWADLKGFEDLRNKIVHHKEKNKLNISLKKAQELRDLTENIINLLNKNLF